MRQQRMRAGGLLRAASILSLVSAAAATDVNRLCFDACVSGVQSVRFSDAEQVAFPAVCHSRLAGWSLLLCSRVFCSNAETKVEDGLRALNETCGETGRALPSVQEAEDYPDDKLKVLPRLTVENRTREDEADEAVIPSGTFHKQWVDTLSATEYVYYYHHAYGWAMIAYWVTIIVIGVLARSWTKLSSIGGRAITESRVSAWYKSHVSVPMAFGSACPRDVGWATVPPRDQAIAAMLFAAVNIVLSCVGYKIFEGNLYYPSTTSQILRYVSDRTGIISFANFPLIWLFGTRNNVVSWLTGWDFPTCTNFHRWVARVATIQAVVHSIGYTILVVREGGWDRFAMWWTYTFWWAGELATVFMCALVAFSFYWVRKRHYETFLVSHIVLSILILVTMLIHVAIFNGLYDPLATVPIMIWLTDRVLRVGRILCFNPKFWTTRAVATYDSDANLVRLEISLAKSFYQFPPGTYCYLMVLHDKTFWQSHPFTIASVRSSVAAKESTEDSDELGPLLQLRSSYEHVDAPVDDEAAENKADVATILVRPYDQFTGRLRDLASEKSGASRSLRVVVEGPYGHTRRLGRFDKVVFITGGSGIAVPLSYLDMLLRRGNGSVVSSVEVHWAVREAPFATKTVSEDMGAWLRDERFSVFTYVSASSRCGGDAALAALEATGINFEMRRGRLECIDRISKAAQAMHHDGAGSLAVVCCGPAGMADDCRQAVARVLSAARGARIEYFEESYNW